MKLPPKALAAISGGRDSVALLHWLISQGHSSLIVCHLNHGLRGLESGQDAALVRRLAKKWALPSEIQKTDVAALAKTEHLSIETAARQARHRFLCDMAARHGTPHVFLAHHAEDQAETVLAHACRGSGLAGISGIKPQQTLRNGLILHRPLLTWRRSEIDAYIAQHHLPFREDSSNQSPAHRRNRLRHQALPLLSEIFQRDVTPALTRLASQALRDHDCLQTQADTWLATHQPIQPDGSLAITSGLKALHPALLSRILLHWLQTHAVPDLDHALIESAIQLLSSPSPAKLNLPGDRHLCRKAKHLRILD